MTKRVGLFGVSGVGKSRLAAEVAGRIGGVLHLQASALLKDELGQAGEALRTSSPDAVKSNQLALAQAFAAALERQPYNAVLLDAHSVIDNDEERVEVPLEAIAPLDLTHIAFLKAGPEEIHRRRSGDMRRRPARTPEQLREYQDHAERVCQHYANELSLPFVMLPDTAAAGELERILA